MQPDALNLFGGFAGLGVLMAGIGFAYAQFKSGAGKAKDDLIETLKESIAAEKAIADRLNGEKTALLESHQQQINTLTEKIGKLQGLYEAAEQRSKEYLSILQGRTPEQKQFNEMVTKAIQDSQTNAKHTAAVLNEIKTFMALMNGEIAKGNLVIKKIETQTQKTT